LRARLVLLAVVLVALVACGGDSDDGRVVLDGRPRFPDAQGVVTEVSRENIALENGKRWRLVEKPQSFSTYTLAQVSLLARKGQYVQIGLDGDRAVWIAAIGAVTRIDPPVVFYNGELLRIEKGQAIFEDGTVLRLAPGVTAPVPKGILRADIDPGRGVVRRLSIP
jgi:hypothetical protein